MSGLYSLTLVSPLLCSSLEAFRGLDPTILERITKAEENEKEEEEKKEYGKSTQIHQHHLAYFQTTPFFSGLLS